MTDLDDWLGKEPSPEEVEYLEKENNRRLQIHKLFDEWFYELEGFTFRSERFWDDFDNQNKNAILKWIRTAYRMGYEEGQKQNLDN